MLMGVVIAALVVLCIAAQQVLIEAEMDEFIRSQRATTPAPSVTRVQNLYAHQDARIRNRCACVTCNNARQRKMMSKN